MSSASSFQRMMDARTDLQRRVNIPPHHELPLTAHVAHLDHPSMTENLSAFFGATSQVIPVLLLVLVLDTAFFPSVARKTASDRYVRFWRRTSVRVPDVTRDRVNGQDFARWDPLEYGGKVTVLARVPRNRVPIHLRLWMEFVICTALIGEVVSLACLAFGLPAPVTAAAAWFVVSGTGLLVVHVLLALRHVAFNVASLRPNVNIREHEESEAFSE